MSPEEMKIHADFIKAYLEKHNLGIEAEAIDDCVEDVYVYWEPAKAPDYRWASLISDKLCKERL